jgi:hypothetical protein
MKWYVLTGIIIAGTATMAGLGYYVLKPKKTNAFEDTGADNTDSGTEDFTTDNIKVAPVTTPTTVTSSFPLKKGSRGELVKNLQNAIIQYFPNEKPLPKYGADGQWGSEVEKFLTDHGLKTVIDNTTYTDYITGNFTGSKTINPNAPKTTATTITSDIANLIVPTSIVDKNVALGYKLYDVAKKGSLTNVLTLLKYITNVAQYVSASKGFEMRAWKIQLNSFFIPTATRYTLVNGLLDAFTSSDDKTKLRAEFRRIGLKETVKNSDPANYDSAWSLSGLGDSHKNIRTTMRAVLTDGFNIRLEVPARTLLGQWLSSGNGYTRFRTHDGRDMYVRTNAVVFA